MTAMLTVKNIMAGETRLRHLERQRGRRVSRGRRGRGAAGARQRAPGAAPARHGSELTMAHRRRSGSDPDAARFERRLRVSRPPARADRHRAAALALFAGERAGAGARLCRLSGAHKSAMSPPLAGVIGYALGTVLHYLLSTRFVFDARATDKVQARLFGEFALSGLAGMGITALVIAAGDRGRRPGGAAGQGAGRRRELPRGVRAAAQRGVRQGRAGATRVWPTGPALSQDGGTWQWLAAHTAIGADRGRTAGRACPHHAGHVRDVGADTPAECRRAAAGALRRVSIAWERFWTLPALAAAVASVLVLMGAGAHRRRPGRR